MNTTHNSTGRKVAKVIGIDLAKDRCDAVGYDENRKICFKLAECSYEELRKTLANMPQAVVLMEACKGSMFHARSIADLGHEVRLVKGNDVKALRNVNQKNDLRDAVYIANLYVVRECQDFCVQEVDYRRGGNTAPSLYLMKRV